MTKLNDLYNNAEALENRLAEINEAIDIEASRLANTVELDVRKASILFTAEDGRKIVVSRRKNTYGEAKIWAHDGNKRGKLIKEGVRESIRRIKIQLANGDL